MSGVRGLPSLHSPHRRASLDVFLDVVESGKLVFFSLGTNKFSS